MPDPGSAAVTVTAATTDAELADVARLRWRWRTESGDAGDVQREDYVEGLVDWARAHRSSHTAYLARHGDQPVGIAWLAVVERIPSPATPVRRGGMVQSVYVVPDRRDAGVGARLMAALAAAAEDQGLDYLMVHPTERALRFYRRAGFAVSEGLLERRFDRPPGSTSR